MPAQWIFSQIGVAGEETEAYKEMRFTAAHSLLEVKDGLGGGSCKPSDALRDKMSHALRDEGLQECSEPSPSCSISSSSCSI